MNSKSSTAPTHRMSSPEDALLAKAAVLAHMGTDAKPVVDGCDITIDGHIYGSAFAIGFLCGIAAILEQQRKAK